MICFKISFYFYSFMYAYFFCLQFFLLLPPLIIYYLPVPPVHSHLFQYNWTLNDPSTHSLLYPPLTTASSHLALLTPHFFDKLQLTSSYPHSRTLLPPLSVHSTLLRQGLILLFLLLYTHLQFPSQFHKLTPSSNSPSPTPTLALTTYSSSFIQSLHTNATESHTSDAPLRPSPYPTHCQHPHTPTYQPMSPPSILWSSPIPSCYSTFVKQAY